jgi:hypothetical protein
MDCCVEDVGEPVDRLSADKLVVIDPEGGTAAATFDRIP